MFDPIDESNQTLYHRFMLFKFDEGAESKLPGLSDMELLDITDGEFYRTTYGFVYGTAEFLWNVEHQIGVHSASVRASARRLARSLVANPAERIVLEPDGDGPSYLPTLTVWLESPDDDLSEAEDILTSTVGRLAELLLADARGEDPMFMAGSPAGQGFVLMNSETVVDDYRVIPGRPWYSLTTPDYEVTPQDIGKSHAMARWEPVVEGHEPTPEELEALGFADGHEYRDTFAAMHGYGFSLSQTREYLGRCARAIEENADDLVRDIIESRADEKDVWIDADLVGMANAPYFPTVILTADNHADGRAPAPTPELLRALTAHFSEVADSLASEIVLSRYDEGFYMSLFFEDVPHDIILFLHIPQERAAL